MKLIPSTVTALVVLLCTLLSPLTFADPEYDAREASLPSALPRFTAISEKLEMVGILNGKQLTLYLDRFADNSPVLDAQMEVDVAGSKYTAEKQGDGPYAITLKDTLKPSVIAITATIHAGELTDLLAGELDLREDQRKPSNRWTWKAMVLWMVAGLLALIALGAILRFRQKARRV